MEQKKYNLSPIELVQLLYDKKAEGFSQKEIIEAEQRLGCKIPAAFRQYLLACGKAEINTCLHSINSPQWIRFSYDDIMECIEEGSYCGIYEKLASGTQEDIQKYTENYLMIWVENQGVWNAGIRIKDLKEDNPKVYITTDDDYFEWAVCSNTIDSFLLSMLYENLKEAEKITSRKDITLEESCTITEKEKILTTLEQLGFNLALLFPSEAPYKNVNIRTCFDEKNKNLYLILCDKNVPTLMHQLNL